MYFRLDDVAGQFNVDLVAAITDAVCPTLDSQPRADTASQCHGKLPSLNITDCSLPVNIAHIFCLKTCQVVDCSHAGKLGNWWN